MCVREKEIAIDLITYKTLLQNQTLSAYKIIMQFFQVISDILTVIEFPLCIVRMNNMIIDNLFVWKM